MQKIFVDLYDHGVVTIIIMIKYNMIALLKCGPINKDDRENPTLLYGVCNNIIMH